jgi:hypothetical protein
VTEAQLYQRLLAMDQMEARAIIQKFRAAGHSLVELYDSVLIPALSLAEQDRHKGALDPEREEFLFLSIGEMVAESAEPPGPESSPGRRILCLPAHDAADEITASMASQVLEQAGLAVVSLPLTPSFHDLLTFLRPEPQDVICISAVPPLALGPAQNLCRQIRTGFPQIRIIIGLWGYDREPAEVARGFDGPGPNEVATTLAAVVDLLTDRVPIPAENHAA